MLVSAELCSVLCSYDAFTVKEGSYLVVLPGSCLLSFNRQHYEIHDCLDKNREDY